MGAPGRRDVPRRRAARRTERPGPSGRVRDGDPRRGGRPGRRPGERAALAALRTEELEAALAVLGSCEHRWLDHPDGGCADVDPQRPGLRPDLPARRRPTRHGSHVRPRRLHRSPRPPGRQQPGPTWPSPRRPQPPRVLHADTGEHVVDPASTRTSRCSSSVVRESAHGGAGRPAPSSRRPSSTARSTRCCVRRRRQRAGRGGRAGPLPGVGGDGVLRPAANTMAAAGATQAECCVEAARAQEAP